MMFLFWVISQHVQTKTDLTPIYIYIYIYIYIKINKYPHQKHGEFNLNDKFAHLSSYL